MANVKLSICIPCYEMNGKGSTFLHRLLETIKRQSIHTKEYEIIISDHSIGAELEDICKLFSLPIVYVKNERGRGSSSININNCIQHSKGEFIKPIFQDDFFTSSDAITMLLENMKTCDWLAHTYIHYNQSTEKFTDPRVPVYNHQMIAGVNTIGPPSTICFKNDSNLFDENLIWFMDTEFYYRLYKKYGYPFVLNKSPLIANCIWSGQVSNTKISDKLISKESNYMQIKHNL